MEILACLEGNDNGSGIPANVIKQITVMRVQYTYICVEKAEDDFNIAIIFAR